MRMATVSRAVVLLSLLAGVAWSQALTREDVLDVLQKHVQQVAQDHDGVYVLKDPETGQTLKLKLVEFHPSVRRIQNYGFFACAEFQPVGGDPEQRYDIDFWVKPEDSTLKVVEARIHKEPYNLNGTWVMKSRQPQPWWWAIAGEHGGEAVGGERKAWEVKATIDGYVKKNADEHGGYFTLPDDKTGQTLQLEMVRIHDPVRKLVKTGQYFACVDFREKGGPLEKLWDLDFWVAPKDGSLEVVQVKVHKEPKFVDGQWVKQPRYKWEGEEVREISFEVYDYGAA